MTAAKDARAAEGGLRVLAAATDAAVLRTIERACSAEHHEFLFATDVAEAIATGTAEQPDLAFVDVTLDGGAGLALVHHLPAVTHRASVYAIVPPDHLELGSQAMALGASGVLLAPPSGDGLLLAISEVRGRRTAAEERARLSADLDAWTRRSALLEAVVDLAGDPDRAKTALVVAESLAEASRASGAAVYAVSERSLEERTRLAAVGSASMLDARVSEGRQSSDRRREGGAPRVPGNGLGGVHTLTLALGNRTVGYVVLDHPSNLEDAGVKTLVRAASAVMGAWMLLDGSGAGDRAPFGVDREARVYPYRRFQDAASREVDRARRHGRRLSFAVIVSPEEPDEEIERRLLEVMRESDVLARGPSGAYYALLPETGSLGADAFRRRLLRLGPPRGEIKDRRSSAPPSRPSPLGLRFTMGVASYPHDGAASESLIVRARHRAEAATRSIVHTRALATRPLGEIVDSLLYAPLPEAATAIPPFSRAELSPSAAHALVDAACREAARGGNATLFVASRAESGTLAVARAAADEAWVKLHALDASHVAASGGAEIVVLIAEHGTWAFCARPTASAVLAAHSSDPILADILSDRLARPNQVERA